LVWDIPGAGLLRTQSPPSIEYRAPEYRRTLDELTALLELGPLLRKPVRNLSLGERMKCEIARRLLTHRPQVVFPG